MIKLVVGLQNPGPDYALTRHNAGAWVLQAWAAEHHLSFKTEKKLHGSLAQLNYHGQSVKCLLPSTFMNHSGQSVRSVCDFYQILPDEVLVVHDELDLPPGTLRLKTGGGHGGHNGLRDIIRHLNSPLFHRLRIGIGHPGHKDQVVDYVLSRPTLEQKKQIDDAVERAIKSLPLVFEGEISAAMRVFNV